MQSLPSAVIVEFALKVGQLPYKLAITQIINKWLLCVKHYYHTTFGIPKKLTHSGSVFIQTLNQKAFEDIFAFISKRSTEKRPEAGICRVNCLVK